MLLKNKYDAEREALGPWPSYDDPEYDGYVRKYGDICDREHAEWEAGLPELDKKFLETQERVLAEIQEKLAEAGAKLAEAADISEEHGIPFTAHISPLGSQRYRPASFDQLWGELSAETRPPPEDMADWSGWERSDICF